MLQAMIRFLRNVKATLQYGSKNTAEIFTDIYHKKGWGNAGPVSGTGSVPNQTGRLIEALPKLIEEYKIGSIVDAPCGDFHWIKSINLSGIKYAGIDIVQEIIDANNKHYARDSITFYHGNLITDPLPEADLILCRDCLVHFSYNNIVDALKNICKANAEYLLTTTFTGRPQNFDIHTGLWRALNLEKPPFNFPKPMALINEGNTENNGINRDKSLGLWKLSTIKRIISR